jgi:hypothetical protein
MRPELTSLTRGEIVMKRFVLFAALIGAMCAPVAANAKGCIKGAIVGGVAGHVAGHGKIGALAGCVIGHHEANKHPDARSDEHAPRPNDRATQ